jgi:ABC-2 type transport system ATP-binding protein
MSPAGTATIEVTALAKRYGQTVAVDRIDFSIGEGEIFGLLGRNGAGKTTTLECVLGLRQPDAGEIRIAGIDARAEPERAKAVVGAQLQAAALQEKLTPRQALRFFASFYANARPAEELLTHFALEEKADCAFDSLSGGQKQRLFLALAFVHRPKVIILDEPTAGLDPQARRELHGVILAARSRGVTILLSTHDLDEAASLCDRLGILDGGRIIATGTPAELIARARAKPRLAVRTVRSFASETVFPGVASAVAMSAAEREQGWTTWECDDLNAALVAVAQHLGREGKTLLDVRIQRPTLEQAFIELTGSAWDEEVRHG